MPSQSTNGKRTTLADLMAAAAIGAIDPSTEVLTAADADAERSTEIAAAVMAAPPIEMPSAPAPALSATEHDCGIVGCRHGDSHSGIVQPDRQVKLECPTCHAVARMTRRALASALGITCHRDGAAFVPAERRTYTRKAN